jgi:hypothetical protein
MTLNQLAGIIPAVVFPAATLGQLLQMIRQRSAAGVSVSTWLLFGVANLAIYFYAERYAEWQAIVGMLVTALLDFAIAALALAARRSRRETATTAAPAPVARRQETRGARPIGALSSACE